MKNIYLDYAATTPVLPEVQAIVRRHLADYGNASSFYQQGRTAKSLIETARQNVATFLGADPSEIVFTSGGTESNNSIINHFRSQHVLTSSIEHPSVLEPVQNLDSYTIFDVEPNARIDLKKFTAQIKQTQPALVSIMIANNELGTLQDIKQLAQIAHRHGACFHTDAVQAFGKIPINVKDLGVDYMTVSAHKIGGLKGVGATYINHHLKKPGLKPFHCGGHQEKNRRAGTENTLGIIAFGAAVRLADPKKYQPVAKLRDYLRDRITSEIADTTINGSQDYILPNLLNISFAGAEGESILAHLDLANIAVSTGSACALGFPSHVLQAIDHDPVLAHNSIRFSLSPTTTQAELDHTITKLKSILKILRSYTSAK